jgi:hypothetical protein
MSTTSEMIWIKQLLADLNIITHSPMKIFCDNQAACHIASNSVFHERTKHIEVDCHFIREKMQAKEIETPYVRSKKQLANILTKSLEPATFEDNVVQVMIDRYL